MGERSVHERELATIERARAEQHRERAVEATTDDEREFFRRAAWYHDEAAKLHDYLAGLYDRQDAQAM
jgi:hypothetical protein